MFEDSPRIQNLIHPSVSRNFFNWTMTYRSDSDIPNPYGRVVPTNVAEINNSGHATSHYSQKDITKLKQLIGANIEAMVDPMERESFSNSRSGYGYKIQLIFLGAVHK